MERALANGCRFDNASGHYESWFLRANHPDRPRGFWIRYTLFAPSDDPRAATGELWAMFFDGQTGRHAAVKTVAPLECCHFAARDLSVRVGSSELGPAGLHGEAASATTRLSWDLRYTSPTPPLLLLKERYYDLGFPKAKALVPSPLAVFTGHLVVDGQRIDIEDWVGSQNHNWGSQHTDRYAWGQVAGFDEDPTAFLECSTARIKLGPVWSPWFTLLTLRLDGEALKFDGLRRAMICRGSYRFFDWWLTATRGDTKVQAHIHAQPGDFVGLPYDNPPGGTKTCLNTKIAACELTVSRPGHPVRHLSSAHRAAFEILTDRDDHGVTVLDVPSGRR